MILAPGQGAGSTAFAASLGSSVIAQYDEIGVVVAQSSDPNFAAQAAALSGVGQVAEDPDRQWLDPNEQAIELTDDQLDANALPPANAETFSALQWNLHQIHSYQTAANGDRGNVVVRSPVAVLDTRIFANHLSLMSTFTRFPT